MRKLIAKLKERDPRVDMVLSGAEVQKPLTKKQLDAARTALGFEPPKLLASAYRACGNGGWGPAYGLLGLGGGAENEDGHTGDALYTVFRDFRKRGDRRWPAGLMPICNLGCAMYHCVQVDSEEMILWEPNVFDDRDRFETALFKLDMTLTDWLTRWADGDDLRHCFSAETGEAICTPMSRPKPVGPKPHPDQGSFLDKL